MSESIVSKETPVQSNPFAKALAGHVNAGAVAIESERAIAEAQGKLVIAKRFPRDQAKAYANIIDACRRPGLAEEAIYSFPRGGKAVSGPSIRLTEMLAANWGNVDYGLRELSRKEGVSEMEAYCWDLETNTMSSQKFTVRHIRDTQGGGKALTDERDIYELTANMGARRLRARILAIIPADLAQAAVDECTKTLAGSNEIPVADRVRNMVTAFNNLGIPTALIEKRLGHPIATILPEEIADLRKIHTSLRDGISKPGDWFGDGASNPDLEAAEPAPERPAPPKRAPKGAAAVVATPEPVQEPKPEPAQSPQPPAEDVNAAMKAREAKMAAATPPKNVTPPKAAEVVKEAAKPAEPVAEQSRAFLKPEERATFDCVVSKIEVCDWSEPTFADGTKRKAATVVALVTGGFQGKVYAFDAATEVDGKLVPNSEWNPGSKVKLTLWGKQLKNLTVQARVEKVEAEMDVE